MKSCFVLTVGTGEDGDEEHISGVFATKEGYEKALKDFPEDEKTGYDPRVRVTEWVFEDMK